MTHLPSEPAPLPRNDHDPQPMSANNSIPKAPGLQRRRLLQAGGSWAGLSAMATAVGVPGLAAVMPETVAAQGSSTSAEPPRLALLIGNRDYPDGDDLPPIHKNIRDLRAVLEKRGFSVSQGLDLDLPQARSLMETFATQVRAAPADATVFFYFSGHGAQVDAENLLVSARVSPKARPDNLARASMTLTADVIGQLPRRPAGLTIAVIDACRTSLRDVNRGDGLNQVEAPPGCLIAFATGAGKPAIAPADDTRNTFYTASLVKVLAEASDEITFSDVFRLVKYDVQSVMLNHPVALLRQFAQFPFIAENTQVRRRLALAPAPAVGQATAAPAPPRFADANEADDWRRLEAALWPAEVARLAADYLKNHPQSRLAGSAQVAREGAAEAAQVLRRSDVRLFRSAFSLPSAHAGSGGEGYGAPPPPPAPALTPEQLADLAKAGRGDKDAAARLARNVNRDSGRWDVGRYEGWLQYAAALGNGIASYDLALHYRRVEQPLLAAQWEARARELGYTPPPSLDNTRK